MSTVRMALLNALQPMTVAMGRTHMPYSHRNITGYHYFNALPHFKAGVAVLTRKSGELSNLFIPGEFTHAAIYCGKQQITIQDETFDVRYVTEAIGKGVATTDLITFMLSKDRVAIYEPIFASEAQMAEAAQWALRQEALGLPYDYGFDPKNKAFYCSELVWAAYCAAVGKDVAFTKRTTLGVQTVTPQDFANAKDKWRLVWDSEKVPHRSAMRV